MRSIFRKLLIITLLCSVSQLPLNSEQIAGKDDELPVIHIEEKQS